MCVFLTLFWVFQPDFKVVQVQRIVDEALEWEAWVVRVPANENQGFGVLDLSEPHSDSRIDAFWDSEAYSLLFNGGYFEHDFSPTGYFKQAGKVINDRVHPRLSGFVAFDREGRLHLLTKEEDLAPYETVLQAGPYVIDPDGKMGIFSRKGELFRRTLVGLTQGGDVLIVSAEPIDLYA